MRIYKVYTEHENFKVIADEIEFHSDFLRETTAENLIFFDGKRVVAVFKSWRYFIDLGEYEPSQSISIEQLERFN